MTVATLSLFLGQSNAMNYSTYNVAYPGGWTAASLGGGYAEAAWTGSGWAQYVPLVSSYGSQPYWGPEATLSLCKRAQTPQVCTYIYKYAVGGVGIEQGWNPYYGSTFSSFITDLTAALAQLTSAGLTPVIKECFWIGDESDCFTWPNASSVQHDLSALRGLIRTQFGFPNMKFVILRTKLALGSGSTSPCPGQLPYVDIVRSAQVSLGSDAYSGWVDADDLPSGTISPGHYDPSGVLTLGTRLFTAAEAIT